MEATVLACSSCGARLSFAVGVRTAECPYCATQMRINGDDHGSSVTFDSAIPNRLSRDQFYVKTLEFLAEGEHTPDDVLLKYAVNEDLHAVFMPFTRFRGKYEGDMTCEAGREVVHYVTKKVGDTYRKERVVDIEWEPFSRQLRGQYSIDVCLGKGIDESLMMNLQSAMDGQSLVKFEPNLLQGNAIEVVDERAEEDELFRERGQPALDDMVAVAAQRQAPTRSRNLRHSYVHTTDQATPYLAPIWLQSYKYNGEVFRVTMEGGSGRLFGYRPKDQDRIAWLDQLKKLGHFSWIPAVILFLFSTVMPAHSTAFNTAAFLALVVGYGFTYYLRNQIATVSRSVRSAILDGIKAGKAADDVASQVAQSEAGYAKIRQHAALVPKLYGGFGALGVFMLAVFFVVGRFASAPVEAAPEAFVAEAPVDAAMSAVASAEPTTTQTDFVSDEVNVLDAQSAQAAEQTLEAGVRDSNVSVRFASRATMSDDGVRDATEIGNTWQGAGAVDLPGAVLLIVPSAHHYAIAYNQAAMSLLDDAARQRIDAVVLSTLRSGNVVGALDGIVSGLASASISNVTPAAAKM